MVISVGQTGHVQKHNDIDTDMGLKLYTAGLDSASTALDANPASQIRVQSDVRNAAVVADAIATELGGGGAFETTAHAEATYATTTALGLKAPLASPAFTGTPTGLLKAHVGLSSVDNTSDVGKPVSTAQAAADTVAKGRGVHTGTQLASTISDFTAAVIAAAPAAGGTLTGTYAARPAGNAVAAGTLYFATNVPESYRSDGTVWSVVGSGGNELGYAASTAMFSSSSTTGDPVTGLTTTFMSGERPFEIRFDGDVANTSATTNTTIHIILDDTVRARIVTLGIGADLWHTVSRRVRIFGLAAGNNHTARVSITTGSGAQIARVTGDGTNPMSISVVTL